MLVLGSVVTNQFWTSQTLIGFGQCLTAFKYVLIYDFSFWSFEFIFSCKHFVRRWSFRVRKKVLKVRTLSIQIWVKPLVRCCSTNICSLYHFFYNKNICVHNITVADNVSDQNSKLYNVVSHLQLTNVFAHSK